MKRLFLSAILLFVLQCLSKAQPGFTITNYATTVTPYYVVVGDLNGDGKGDLVVANGGGNTVSVILNKGDNSFDAAVNYATGNTANVVAIGDLNGDHYPDIVVANWGTDNVSVLLNKGDGSGSFEEQQIYATGGSPFAIAIEDINGDSYPDLAVANKSDATVSVLLNKGDGSGSFQAQTAYATGSAPHSVAIADFNGDHLPDIVTANQNDNTISVLLQKEDGGFETQVAYPTGNYPTCLCVSDFNGDSNPDIAVTNGIDNTVSVRLNKGDGSGSFDTPAIYATGSQPFAVTAGDINRDGKADLSVANYGADNLSVLLNEGDGTFDLQQTYTTGDVVVSVCTGDIDGDGNTDIAAANMGSNSISLLLNTAVALPVTQLSYTGMLKNSIAILQWQSGVENNIDHYEIEKSTGGKTFTGVTDVVAKGSNSHYFCNVQQTGPLTYYRLKWVEKDGRVAYHDKIIALSQEGNEGVVLVYPNPARDHIHIRVAAAGSVSIYDAAGRLVKTQALSAGVNNMDIHRLGAGVYYAVVNGQRVQLVKY